MPEPPSDLSDPHLLPCYWIDDVDPQALDAFGALDLSLDLYSHLPARVLREGSDRPIAPPARRNGADRGLSPNELDASLDPLCSVLVEEEKHQSTLIVFSVPVRAHGDFGGVEFVQLDGVADEDGRGVIDVGAGWLSPEICFGTGVNDDGGEIHVDG